MNQADPFQNQTNETTPPSLPITPLIQKPKSPLLPILLTFLITSILFVGGFFGYQYLNKTPSSTPSPIPTVEAPPESDPTADWEAYTSPLFSYSFKYPSTWGLQSFETNPEVNKVTFGSNSLQNYSITEIEQYMDHGSVNWGNFLGNNPGIKIDFAVYSKKTEANRFNDKNTFIENLIPSTAKKQSISDLTIGNLPTEHYKNTENLGPTDVPEINTFVAYPDETRIIYVNLLFWNTPDYAALKKTPEWQEFTQILSTFSFTPTPPATSSQSPSSAKPAETKIAQAGTITGKLCYPSSYLPAGTIEAKNLSTNVVFTHKYEGSEIEPDNKYSIEIPSGIYHLRYIGGKTPGYHTPCSINPNECTTDESHRLIDVIVEPETTSSNIDLCDYYYSPENEPRF